MENYKNKLMSKNGRVTMLLARELLAHNEGDRIKTIGEYAGYFDTGRGTVQSALRFLQDSGAISLESKGHLGTYILMLNYKNLWEISDLGVIMGVMPLPYSKRYEGLATGLYKAFEKANIPFSLAFMRGSKMRMQALTLGKYSFAIVSKLAANLEMETNPNIEIVHEFSEGSYVKNHVIIFKDKNKVEIEDKMRIALDTSSIDQAILTSWECKGKDVQYVETSYSQIIQKLMNNEIDAAIWNADEIDENNLELNIQPLKNLDALKADRDDTIAAILTSKDNENLGDTIKKFIEMDFIEYVQKKVISKEIIPTY